ncbi:MAG TPA: hypothetical protein VFJ14_03375 [Nocardioidaceae bacterium]|nr:hypothetical protein [Nocardioidaceae bacterium]
MARHSNPRPGRRTRSLLAVSLLLLLTSAVGLGVALARSASSDGARPPRSAAPPSASQRAAREGVHAADWVQVLARLDARRSAAFAAGDAAALGRVYVDGSPALRTDRRLLRRYADRGLHVTGLRLRVAAVRLLAVGETHAVLQVRDRVAAGRVEDDDGNARPLGDDTWSRHRLRLERGGDGWRIADLELVG